MKKVFGIVAAVAVAMGATVVFAQQDPITARKALMKQNGADAKAAAAMVKGEAPFDLAKAQKIFADFEAAAAKFPTMFPENSKTGGETSASPNIWQDMAGFKAAAAKLGADAKAASASVKDIASFRAAFGAVAKNCGGCHETYRIKKS